MGADTSHERSRYFMKQWICGANEKIKFTKKGMAYNTNSACVPPLPYPTRAPSPSFHLWVLCE